MHAVSFPMWFWTVQMKSRNAAREEGHMKNGWKVEVKSMDAGFAGLPSEPADCPRSFLPLEVINWSYARLF